MAPTKSAASTGTRLLLLFLCIFFAGAAGLVYEVIWSRQLTLFLGTSAHAHAAVLTAYMFGLGLGSYIIGRAVDRLENEFRLYGIMELCIGVYALAMPHLIIGISNLYPVLTPILGISGVIPDTARFLIAVFLMLIPTFLMGGTLPVLVKGLTGKLEQLGQNTARIYAINTFGAATGAWVTGYILIPRLGIQFSTWIGVALSILAGTVVFLLWRGLRTTVSTQAISAQEQSAFNTSPDHEEGLNDRQAIILLVGFGVSGFVAMQLQVSWIKSLVLVIGSSVYAFSATLTIFLVGIAAGSLLAVPLCRHAGTRNLVRLIIVLQALLAISSLASIAIIGRMPEWFISAFSRDWLGSFVGIQVFELSLVFVALIIPTLVMGIQFPIVARLWTRSRKGVGVGIGGAYAVNTGGAIAGIIASTWITLPWLGIQGTVICSAILSTAVCMAYAAAVRNIARPLDSLSGMVIPALLTGLALTILPPWNTVVMQSGMHLYGDGYLDDVPGKRLDEVLRSRYQQIFYREGVNGVVSVDQARDEIVLVVNGKADASSVSDMPTQVLLGQLPLLLHPQPKTLLVIGMGSGVTAGTGTTHSDIESIDIVEISPEVVDAARLFAAFNENIHDDPRTRLILADGRNYVASTTQKYDVIISEPPNPWISGVANLFTREFFSAARERMNTGGILSQWFHSYSMSVADQKSLFRTITSEFKYVMVWIPTPGDLIFLASDTPISLDDAQLHARMGNATVAKNLALGNIDNVGELLNHYLMPPGEARAYGADGALNTDNYPYIEFNAPRSLYRNTIKENLRALFNGETGPSHLLALENMVVPGPDSWEIPAAQIRISRSGSRTPPDSRWAIRYQTGGEIEEYRVNNAVVTRWQGSGGLFELLATAYTGPGAGFRPVEMLQRFFPRGTTDSGDSQVGDGRHVWWALGPASQPDSLLFAMVWECESTTGVTRQYLARQHLPVERYLATQLADNLVQSVHCMDN